MSGILGRVRFDGACPADISPMIDAMRSWAPDGIDSGSEQGAVFARMLLQATPEDVHSRMPATWPERSVLLTAEGRLDNRDDVIRLLGLTAPEGRLVADSGLMLLAYQAWGEECAPRLLGDWSMAAWSASERRLFLARDQHGNTALYLYRDPATGDVAFASDPRALHAAGAPRRLNELFLAQLLVSWASYHGPQTIDLDIQRLPPAHTCVVTADGIALRRYWFPESVAGIRLGSMDEYAEGLLAVYDEAVRARCRSARPVGITLSGGLDSGSVAALAARALRERGADLHAYTHVPVFDTTATAGRGGFGDEARLAGSTAAFAGITDHRLLDSSQVTPVDGIERALTVLDQPAHAASNAFWLHDILATARADGMGTLLTGQGGNATVSWTGRPDMWTFAGRIRRSGLRAGIGYLLPAGVQRHRMRSRMLSSRWSHTSINPDFADRIHLADRCSATIGRDIAHPEVRASTLRLRAAITQPGASRVGDLWALQGGHEHLEIRDPTTDARVIEYAFAVPDEVFHGPGGSDRELLRQAMRGLLPDDVRCNQDRGRQSADLAARLIASAPQVDRALAGLAAGPAPQYLDLARMRQAWDQARGNPDPLTTHRAGSILLRGMMAGLWINRTYG